jgi:beta-ribofuranosylaminobenzene 5'-phosphate synthase
MSYTVEISAPSRLHFGLLRFAQAAGPSYGGIGMMVDRPGLKVEVAAASQWDISGPSADRAERLARQALQVFCPKRVQALRIRLLSLPPQHVGLGVGTQLALALATASRKVCDLSDMALSELAAAMGRAARSAVGSYGFCHGGLILETGRMSGHILGGKHRRQEVPSDWRVLLVIPKNQQGRYGKQEAEAFRKLPPIPTATTERLLAMATGEIFPAAAQNDTSRFDEALYEYGILAGNCFAEIQGGPFASADIASRVAILRAMNLRGVGQSSWGPTLFALVRDADPESIATELRPRPEFADCHFTIAAPDNRGAVVTVKGR